VLLGDFDGLVAEQQYVGGVLTPLSKPFKTKQQAEKARRKCPERQRRALAVGVVRIKL